MLSEIRTWYNVCVLITTLNLTEGNHYLSCSEQWNNHFTSFHVELKLPHCMISSAVCSSMKCLVLLSAPFVSSLENFSALHFISTLFFCILGIIDFYYECYIFCSRFDDTGISTLNRQILQSHFLLSRTSHSLASILVNCSLLFVS